MDLLDLFAPYRMYVYTRMYMYMYRKYIIDIYI